MPPACLTPCTTPRQVGATGGRDVLQLPPGHAALAEGEKSLGEKREGRAAPSALLDLACCLVRAGE